MKVKEKIKKKTARKVGMKITKPARDGHSRVVLSNVTIGEVSDPDLLSEWIAAKRDEYLEPQREGTPKGEAIGFGLKKYTAVLLSLTNNQIKETAELAEVSYGVLRTWRTEPDFKSQVGIHRREFENHFCNYVLQHIDTSVFSNIPARHPAMRCVPFYSDDLGVGIIKLAHARAVCKTKADKQWWVKRGYSDSDYPPLEDAFKRFSFLGGVYAALDEGHFRELLEERLPASMSKMFFAYLRWHIRPEKGKPTIDKDDALALLDMMERNAEFMRYTKDKS